MRVDGIEEVILTGVSSEFVVLAAAMSAHDRDIKVTVLEDCIASSDESSHLCAVHIMKKISDVTTSYQLID